MVPLFPGVFKKLIEDLLQPAFMVFSTDETNNAALSCFMVTEAAKTGSPTCSVVVS